MATSAPGSEAATPLLEPLVARQAECLRRLKHRPRTEPELLEGPQWEGTTPNHATIASLVLRKLIQRRTGVYSITTTGDLALDEHRGIA